MDTETTNAIFNIQSCNDEILQKEMEIALLQGKIRYKRDAIKRRKGVIERNLRALQECGELQRAEVQNTLCPHQVQEANFETQECS